ncbi:hypothetical protein XH93_34335 [Bradyrhizobium sp. CCBAU 51753]|nr:hypothetical protein XH93_34335 [Bradyrhizobium sp. CCBAU 51753]
MISERAIKGLRRLRPAIVDVEFFKDCGRLARGILGVKQHQFRYVKLVLADRNLTGVKSSMTYSILLPDN